MGAGLAREWTFRSPWGEVLLAIDASEEAPSRARREESVRLVGQLAYAFKYRDAEACRLVADLRAMLRSLPPSVVRHEIASLDTGSARADAMAEELLAAVRAGRLSARRRETRTMVVPLEGPGEEFLGPQSSPAEVPDDVHVLAAQINLIGDTPLIQHPVRVLDPDTGAIVVDGLTTDDKGVVRTPVPDPKKYRIEILDQAPDWVPVMRPDPPQAVLLCEFVDVSGAPLADRDVTATGEGGAQFDFTTDDEGKASIPALLGHYTLKIDDHEWDAYALLPDDDDGDTVYRFVVESPDQDPGPADDPANRLVRLDDSFGEGADADAGADGDTDGEQSA